ncbi:MAG: hypothetical protein JWM88_255 [Verrucomicrobia bacterium]|nr:hypothetical protein [Verrucomicrobiota bacterium]
MKTNTSLFNRTAWILGAFVSVAGFASANPLSGHSDKSFVEKAAKKGMEEVSISQVVAERSTNPQVKEFATMMVADHSAANTELSALAASKGIALPAKETAPGKWSKKTGKDFDEDYMEKMTEDHDEAVKLFNKEASDGKDQDIVAFARKTLPTLQHHQQMAKDLKKALKGK